MRRQGKKEKGNKILKLLQRPDVNCNIIQLARKDSTKVITKHKSRRFMLGFLTTGTFEELNSVRRNKPDAANL